MHSARVNNFKEWRQAAREYVASEVPPAQIQWESGKQTGLFAEQDLVKQSNTLDKPVAVPVKFLSQLEYASCYLGNEPSELKWSLFYSLLWRITKIDRDTLSLKSDMEVQQFERMQKSVNRDIHKMKAFVRFKTEGSVFDQVGEGVVARTGAANHYTAWFEPEHAIIQQVAPFFMKRFTGMSWSILTPHGCAHWDQKKLMLSPGTSRPDIPQDEFDDFWRAYYRSIFNPARLKEQAMRSEMPKKYWQYLPESICIQELANQAASRVEKMNEAEATDSERVRQRSQQITALQDQLRRENKL